MAGSGRVWRVRAGVLAGVLCGGVLAAGGSGGSAVQVARAAGAQVGGTRAVQAQDGGVTGDVAQAGAAGSVRNTAARVQVRGNRLVGGRGQRVVLRGVDRSGGEYACVQGFGMWDGPMDQASVSAMKGWHVNAVRVPLNEACWNGEGYVKRQFRGARYRAAVEAYVRLLNDNSMVAILDLHWTDGKYTGPSSGCASSQAVCQKPMPDKGQSVRFWTSVARVFRDDDSVIFDLFNEPYPERAPGGSEAEGWRCWLGGGACAGIGYPVAGMQLLVDAIRSTGARNVIMLGGLGYSNDLTGWLKHKPKDVTRDLVASWHSYNFNSCANASCWNHQVAPVIAKVPVIVGEMGENDCADGYIGPLMSWLDARSASYLGWAWNADFACTSGPSLITNYSGTPTGFGAGYRAHLRALR